MFELESENLTGLGGPMGTEETTINWRKFFTTVEKAKEFAEKDYKKKGGREEFDWHEDDGEWCSGDLLFVMYNIRPVKVEE